MHGPTNDNPLRRQAEERLRRAPETPDTLSSEETRRLLHELRVHQIELEMQNAELRQTQEQLTAARDRYLDLYDYAPVGYLTLNQEGRVLHANLTCADLLRVDRHALLTQPFAHFIARDGQNDYHFFRERLSQSDAPQTVELLLKKADGAIFWARLDAITARETFPPETREITTFRLTISDVTARKQAEEENARQTAELAATMASMADGLLVFNQAGDIIRMNDTAASLLGAPPGEAATPFDERLRLLQVEDLKGSTYPVEEMPSARALRGETTQGAIMVWHHPQRTSWVFMSAAPIHMPDGRQNGAVATISDITALHDLQEQQFLLLHLISHDLRTPLSIIHGHVQLIEGQLGDREGDEALFESLQAIQRSVRRMKVMIEDLTEMARFEGGQVQLKRELLDLATYLPEFLRRAATFFDVQRVHLEVGAEVPAVLADYDRLERIIANLLSNAFKYSDPGTPVLLRACVQQGEVVVSITDQGRGIAPDEIPHLFQRFFRAKTTRKAEGIGLGLYITKQLVAAHGGHIRVESEPGMGSTFFFSLPVAKP